MWHVQLHGATDDLSDNEAKDAEISVVTRLQRLVAELVPGGHSGVAATFTGDHVGTVALTDAPPDAEPAPVPAGSVVADGTVQPAPTEPPPTFVTPPPGEPAGGPSDPQGAGQQQE